MAAAIIDFEIEQGATFRQPMVFSDSAGDPVVAVTGWSWAGEIKERLGCQNTLASFDFDLTSTTPGEIIVEIAASGTAKIPIKQVNINDGGDAEYLYDITATTQSGLVYRVFQGKAIVSPQVTK